MRRYRKKEPEAKNEEEKLLSITQSSNVDDTYFTSFTRRDAETDSTNAQTLSFLTLTTGQLARVVGLFFNVWLRGQLVVVFRAVQSTILQLCFTQVFQ